jgi:hypothetical protein
LTLQAVLFLAIAWAMPTYALRPPPTTISVHRHVRIRRASVDTTVSESPTLVEDAAEDKLGDAPPKDKVRLEDRRDEIRRGEGYSFAGADSCLTTLRYKAT